jgi:hypothetical protein
MFLNMLNDEEKKAFALLAEKMIEADGIVVGSEAAALAALEGEMGISRDDAARRPVEELAAVFQTKRSRAVAMLELIGLGYSDTSFSVNEQSIISGAAAAMGISADELTTLEDWVKKYVDLVREAMALIRE